MRANQVSAAIVCVLMSSAMGCMVGDDPPSLADEFNLAAAATGNGSPSGAHFNLNVIGVSNTLTQSNSGGAVIHVPLNGSCQINLAVGDYQVLDDNCTDGTAAF